MASSVKTVELAVFPLPHKKAHDRQVGVLYIK